MFNSTHLKDRTVGYDKILFIGLMATLCLAFLFSTGLAQTDPKPASGGEGYWNGYNISTTTEFGWRWRRVSGNDDKYKSDLNYKQGFRVFDSNFFMQSDSGKGKYFDALLVSNSGWGSDPSGYTRVNMEKIGIYKLNANVRRIKYFNDLLNHANPFNTANPLALYPSEHSQDTTQTMGDFDITVLPQNDRFRVNFGMSLGKYSGPGVYTTRAYSDEFAVPNFARNTSDDFRVGVDGMLAGFNLSFTQGFRIFHDRTDWTSTGPIEGNNLNGTASANAKFATFSRVFPTDGHAYYSQFSAHRTIAKKLDFTARFIYSSTDSNMSLSERITGRDNNNNIVVLDRFDISARAKRPQSRGDLGVTYNVTDNFRISNTFSFDQFAVNGGEALFEQVDKLNSAGINPTTSITNSSGYRVTRYRKYINTLEGDYQFNNSIALHLGWRYTHREIGAALIDRSSSVTTEPFAVEETNGTHTIIAGMKIKPVKNWVIFWDIERGTADNVFTRVENYKFTNFRVRTRYTFSKFAFNFSAISKDNTNPSKVDTSSNPTDPNLGLDFGAVVKNRFYSGTIEWNPIPELSFSTGYTYHHLTSHTAVYLYVVTPPATSSARTLGFSEFFMRDHYFYFDVSAKPAKRVSLFASYRIDRDTGQGDRVWNVAQNIITSYPMRFTTPEFRVAFRITRNIDWNIGYQYYKYDDIQTPLQNYKASLPFTSLRIYFGNGSADR